MPYTACRFPPFKWYSDDPLGCVHLSLSTNDSLNYQCQPESSAHRPRIADCPWQLTSDFCTTIVRLLSDDQWHSTSLEHQLSASVPRGRVWHRFIGHGLTTHSPTVTTHPICECAQNRLFYPRCRGPRSRLLPYLQLSLKTPFEGVLGLLAWIYPLLGEGLWGLPPFGTIGS